MKKTILSIVLYFDDSVKVHCYKKTILKICHHQHLNVDQIFAELKTYFPKVVLSTVYRNVQELIASWELKEVFVLNGKNYYETDVGLHAHLIDNKTGMIHDIDLPDFVKDCLPKNFTTEKINLNIFGTFK